jgi:6-phosphogluconolactonase
LRRTNVQGRRQAIELEFKKTMPFRFCIFLCLVVQVALVARAEQLPASTRRAWVFIGTYTAGDSKGIYRADLDLTTGEMSQPQLAATAKNPSFLALHPGGRFLYAVNEVGDGTKAGMVSAFALDPMTGKLDPLNDQPSRGGGPCYLTVDRSGKNLLVANYGGGSVASLPIGSDGRLSPASAFIQHTGKSINRQRQEAPHVHSVNLDPNGRFAIVADLGLDKVFVYRFNADKGTLMPNDRPFAAVTAGSGPRHFAFHPSGRFGYLINEIYSTVTAFDYDATGGVLREIQTISTLPQPQSGNSTAEVQVHPSGKFLYGSNRGHDSLAIFSIDQNSGRLTTVGHQPTGGKTPRNFGIGPNGTFLLAANQSSNNVVVFRIDQQTGRLTPTGHSIDVDSPVCVKFVRIPN